MLESELFVSQVMPGTTPPCRVPYPGPLLPTACPTRDHSSLPRALPGTTPPCRVPYPGPLLPASCPTRDHSSLPRALPGTTPPCRVPYPGPLLPTACPTRDHSSELTCSTQLSIRVLLCRLTDILTSPWKPGTTVWFLKFYNIQLTVGKSLLYALERRSLE